MGRLKSCSTTPTLDWPMKLFSDLRMIAFFLGMAYTFLVWICRAVNYRSLEELSNGAHEVPYAVSELRANL